MNLSAITVRPIKPEEEIRFQELMEQHHYLGKLPKIGHSIRYVALYDNQWVAILSFSAAALKCKARDNWIGWEYRHQYGRLHLVANNSRFLILPRWHFKNLATKVLSLCRHRIQQDWISYFGYPLLLLETFVDPSRFGGTVYRAANWHIVGETKGFRRTSKGYSQNHHAPKLVFVLPLQRNACKLLSAPLLEKPYLKGIPKMKLKAEHMRSLPEFFRTINDPRSARGRRHPLPTVLGIATAAILCGMRGYKAISDWAQDLTPKARARFRCCYRDGQYRVPSESIIRDVMLRVDPVELDKALQLWNSCYGADDQSLAIDGKTMCNAIDDDGRQIHIMSAIGHQSSQCYTQKKWEPCQ